MSGDALELLRTSSLASLLRQEIEHLIMSGALRGGERINENALAARFHVSRGPIREACRALAESGLLQSVPNRGHFVRSVSRDEADELYDVRGALFSLALRSAAKRIGPLELKRLDQLLAEMELAAEHDSIEDYYPLNLRFHDELLELSGNTRLVLEYQSIIKELHLFRARGLVHGGGLVLSNSEHREIVDTLRCGDEVGAAEAGFRHVQNGKQRSHALPHESSPAATGARAA